MAEIGATLRETRMRARVDVSEIEAQTKIRAKYLRALENEEWDLLPGPTFVRSFLRTYAQALGLDDKALVDEYRRVYERPVDFEHQPPVMASPRRQRAHTPAGRPSRGYLIAVGVIALLIVLLLVGLITQKKGGPSTPTSNRSAGRAATSHRYRSGSRAASAGSSSRTGSALVAVSIHPSAPVWVCLIGDGTRRAIPGVILQPSYSPVTYHARRFTLVLGNDEATIYVNGRPESVPTTSQAIGYSIDAGGRHPLAGERLPTCK
jgi:cytoskeleton protein RodZ